MFRSRFVSLVAVLLVVGTLSTARPAAAESGASPAWVAGAVVASLVYTPIKLTTAAVGGFLGAAGWFALGGDDEVAEEILVPSVTGDYFVAPDQLRGERPLEFFGR